MRQLKSQQQPIVAPSSKACRRSSSCGGVPGELPMGSSISRDVMKHLAATPPSIKIEPLKAEMSTHEVRIQGDTPCGEKHYKDNTIRGGTCELKNALRLRAERS